MKSGENPKHLKELIEEKDVQLLTKIDRGGA